MPVRKRDGKPVATGNRGNWKQQQTPAKARTKLYRHPDRLTVEALLCKWSAYRVQRWLEHRYPIDDSVQPSEANINKTLRLSRKTLIEYRDKYLLDEMGASWREPIDDSPLGQVLPPRIGAEQPLWELEAMEGAYHAAEFILAKCLKQDEELGMTQEMTLTALQTMRDTAKQRAELAAKLGIFGYEEAARKVQIDQRLQGLMVHGRIGQNTPPAESEPERLKYARRMLELGAGADDMMEEARNAETQAMADVVIESEEAQPIVTQNDA